MKKQALYLVNSVLATGVLYYVLRLSRGDRGVVDGVVIGLVCCALGWNLVQLGRRLCRRGGGRDLWHLLRTITFWIVGWLNTGLIRAEDAGTWKNWLGWALLLIAAADTIALFLKERRALDHG